MNNQTLERILAAPRLPTLPSVAMRVLELTDKKDVSLREIADTIQNDQGLASRILKTVNSSFYGLPKKCSTINQAMVALGINTVKTLALGFSLVKLVKDGEGEGFDYIDYWRRAVYTGVGARIMARTCRACDPDEVFLGGLLQDLGMIAMFQVLGEQYLEATRRAKDDHRLLAKIEIELLEVQHPDLGALLAQRWRLPDSLTMPIKYHERPGAAPQKHAAAVQCIAVGNIAADLLAKKKTVENLPLFYEKCHEWFGMDRSQADEALRLIGEGAKDVSHLLRVPIGESPSMDEILGMAGERLVAMTIEQEHAAEELAQKNAELRQAAVTDSLTGAANRRRFDEVVSDAFARARATSGLLAVIVIDADKFKSVNDTHGHQAGDAVLVELSARLQKHFEPEGGVVCRYGGEEFAIILEGCGRAESGRLIDAFRTQQAERPISTADCGAKVPELTLTVSAGVAAYEPATSHAFSTVEQLIRAADQAVYAAKGSGRNCVRVFNPRPPKIAA